MFTEDRIGCPLKCLLFHERGSLVLTLCMGFQMVYESKDLPAFDGVKCLDLLDNLGSCHVNTRPLAPVAAKDKKCY